MNRYSFDLFFISNTYIPDFILAFVSEEKALYYFNYLLNEILLHHRKLRIKYMPITRKQFLQKAWKFSAGMIFSSSIPMLAGCEADLFDYSIHEIKGKYSGEKINSNNISKIEKTLNTETDFSFAFLTDSHDSYDDLNSSIQHISLNPDISFVIFGGDMTESGLLFEYEQYVKQMKKLSIPFLTIIGNHDTLGNGYDIFTDIFDTYEYTFSCNNVLFVSINNNDWTENNVSHLDSLKKTLSENQNSRYRIVLAHIPIARSPRLGLELETAYLQLCKDYNISLTLNGHIHYHNSKYFDPEKILMCDAVFNRSYYLIHVKSEGISFERIIY